MRGTTNERLYGQTNCCLKAEASLKCDPTAFHQRPGACHTQEEMAATTYRAHFRYIIPQYGICQMKSMHQPAMTRKDRLPEISKDKQKLLSRIKRLAGQIDAV